MATLVPALVAVVACGAKEGSAPAADSGPALRAQLRTSFRGGSGFGRQVAFSRDGRWLATTNSDGTVALRSVPDGRVRTGVRHPHGATAVAVSPDGRWLASAGYDGTVKLWRVPDGRLLHTLSGHEGTVWSLAVGPAGDVIASGGEDRTIRLWRVADGAAVRTLSGHERNVWAVDFAGHGLLTSGSFDETVKLWRVSTGELVKTLRDHEQAVVALDVSPDGSMLATAGDDATVRLWRLPSAERVRTIDAGNHVYSVAWSPDGRWLASGGREKGALGTLWKQVVGARRRSANGTTVRLWRASDGRLQQSLAGHSDDVWSVAFSPDGRWIATSGGDGSLALWRLLQPASTATPSPTATRPGRTTVP